MTKKQLLAENQALRKALKIVCVEPNSEDAIIIKFTQIHIAKCDKLIWFGSELSTTAKFNFNGLLTQLQNGK